MLAMSLLLFFTSHHIHASQPEFVHCVYFHSIMFGRADSIHATTEMGVPKHLISWNGPFYSEPFLCVKLNCFATHFLCTVVIRVNFCFVCVCVRVSRIPRHIQNQIIIWFHNFPRLIYTSHIFSAFDRWLVYSVRLTIVHTNRAIFFVICLIIRLLSLTRSLTHTLPLVLPLFFTAV